MTDPALSVVLVSATGRRNLRRTLAAVAAQTIASQIEVLILTPDQGWETGEARLPSRLHSVRTFREARIDDVDFAAGRLAAANRWAEEGWGWPKCLGYACARLAVAEFDRYSEFNRAVAAAFAPLGGPRP